MEKYDLKYYLYLVSEGYYSSYSVEQIAVHTKDFSKEELEKIMEEVKEAYIAKWGKPERYTMDHTKRDEEFNRILREKGFTIVYPEGEFSLGDYATLDEMHASKPWRDKDQPPSALRVGL